MRKALRSLAGEGKIRPLRHGYTFGHTARFSYGTIVIIAQHHHIGLLSTRVPYVASFFTTLEQEQRRLGFNVHTVMSGFFYDRTEAEVRNRTTFAEIEKAHATIGYLVLATGHRDHRIRRILQDAQAIGKPVALLDGTGFCERNDVPRYRNVRAFPLKTQDAGPGADMGSYLLSRGHRHAAYFTYEPEPLWSKRRFAGLRRAFSPEAGMTSLHSFLVPAVNARELERRQASGEHADLYRLEGAHFRGRYLKPADEFLRVRSSARAAFEAAALVPEITAWIAGNDALALQAWYYLRRDNPHVPPERALCGFDNSFDAFAHGITSYDFNSSSALHAMLEFVLAADTRGGERVVEVPGGLVKRQSTEGRAVRVAERL